MLFDLKLELMYINQTNLMLYLRINHIYIYFLYLLQLLKLLNE